jgi:hypothetical protein
VAVRAQAFELNRRHISKCQSAQNKGRRLLAPRSRHPGVFSGFLAIVYKQRVVNPKPPVPHCDGTTITASGVVLECAQEYFDLGGSV